MSENSSLSFNDALNTLESFTSKTFIGKHYVPSMKKEIEIKELTSKQQKKLLGAAMDSATISYKPTFIKSFYEILLENCLEDKDLINKLTFIDRMFLTISMRNQLSNEIKLNFSKEEDEIIDLNIVVQRFKDFLHPEQTTINLIKNDVEIVVNVGTPSIKREIDYLNSIPDAKEQKSETENLKYVISESYIYETAKYMTDIIIGGKDLNYNSLSILQRCALTEKLPAIISQKVLETVTPWKSSIDELFTITSNSGKTKILEPDAMLFLTN